MLTTATKETLGDRILRRRKELQMTRLELALAIGVVPTTVQSWEKNWKVPHLTIPKANALCKALQMSLDELSEGLAS